MDKNKIRDYLQLDLCKTVTRQKSSATVNYSSGVIRVNVKYLLPCSCGAKIPVETRQAGEIVSCRCGRSLEVPTLLKLKTLPRTEVAAQAETPKKAWNTGHRLILLGAVIIIAGSALGARLFWIRPTDPFADLKPEQIKEAMQIISPRESWRRWLFYENVGPVWHKRDAEITFAGQQAQYQIYWVLTAAVIGTGLASIIAGTIVIQHRRERNKHGKTVVVG